MIYNYPEQLFADAGVMAIEHADFDGIERLALVLGGGLKFTKLLHNIVQFQIPVTHVHLEKFLVAMWFLVQMFVCM